MYKIVYEFRKNHDYGNVINYNKLDLFLNKKINSFDLKELDLRIYEKCEIERIVNEIFIYNSINFSLFYGTVYNEKYHDIKLKEIISESFNKYNFNTEKELSFFLIENIKKEIVKNRFSMIIDRLDILTRIFEKRSRIKYFIRKMIDKQNKIKTNLTIDEESFNFMVETFEWFSSDLFLKRASSFFIQLYGTFGWFKYLMKDINPPIESKLINLFIKEKIINCNIDNDIMKHSDIEVWFRITSLEIFRILKEKTNNSTYDLYMKLINLSDINECENKYKVITTDY